MLTKIVKKVKGNELIDLVGEFKAKPDKIFTVTIEEIQGLEIVKDVKAEVTNGHLTKADRNRFLDILEKLSGNENSEDWINIIKSSHSSSELKSF